ncbi:polyprenyl synthetase family protein [Saccharopolyspora terrae]|uniref:Polyprenyl synthetase family protein n=1 Tax=Saccharopolyspora terrae TaxID=2530384 RepID=A0A4R4W0D5_9PSEU|nr:family 2 encapsulin nanocompartment cargo protein polyprenyl transferase [Saccharopolyspora terrae]TDD10177.1 polyprenyl synthetase family protein [Saccharopolyspora terrae]
MTATGARPTNPPAHEVLDWGRQLVTPALRTAVDTLPEDMRHIAGYHFGWWDEHGRSTQASGGKALRATLVFLTAEAVGGSAPSALPAAAAVELVHNFSLLHDDVIDHDATRRHRPTAWSVFGTSAAILAGDALVSLASDVLAESTHPAGLRGIRMLNSAIQVLIEGQITDIAFEQRTDVDLHECQRMAQAKTGTLLGAACELGVLFGGGTSGQAQHLRTYGENLGLAFQHVDDLLGIWGDPEVTGKPAYSDLHGRKKTLPIVAALKSRTPAGNELAARYQRDEPLAQAELIEVAELVDTAGGRVWSQGQADQLLAEAQRHLHAARLVARTTELEALAHLVTRRDH